MRDAESILAFVERKAQIAHADTWEFFNDKPHPSVNWLCAKERENLCGEILRFIHSEKKVERNPEIYPVLIKDPAKVSVPVDRFTNLDISE
jgi:hypothetical protein